MNPNASLRSSPVLTCDEAKTFEEGLFAGNESSEWGAMCAAGAGVAQAIARDMLEAGGFSPQPSILLLAGKGHNAGDAFIAAKTLLRAHPSAHIDVILLLGERTLRPLAQRAWAELLAAGASQIQSVRSALLRRSSYDLCIDGVFGFPFRAPLAEHLGTVFSEVETLEIRLRASVDLPSGFGETNAFRADFTYATAIVKHPLLSLPNAGRLRFVDLGWSLPHSDTGLREAVLLPQTLQPLAGLRAPRSDKRTFGHLAVVGGSRNFPGAILMCVRAALRSGVGLLTAFVPESLVPSFAAAVPEAMWVGWPETDSGGLALEGAHLLRERLGKASALVIGPGMGHEAETLLWVVETLRVSRTPVVIDADALRPDIVFAGSSPRILTPHTGEYERISDGAALPAFARKCKATVVLKGPSTQISSGDATYRSFFGGPVLARGGSGDLLSGLIGGLLAQTPDDTLLAAARGVLWHGLAADELAQKFGPAPVTTTQLLDHLPAALRRSLW